MRQNKTLLPKLENVSAKDIGDAFVKREHISDAEREVAQKDIEDAYQLRKFFNQAIQKAWVYPSICVNSILGT